MRMGIICVCVCVYTMRKDEFGCKERMCTLPRGHEMAFIFFNLVCTSVRYTSLYTPELIGMRMEHAMVHARESCPSLLLRAWLTAPAGRTAAVA